MTDNNTILIYQDKNEITKITVRFSDEDYCNWGGISC